MTKLPFLVSAIVLTGAETEKRNGKSGGDLKKKKEEKKRKLCEEEMMQDFVANQH